jgi:hypothetical protein
VDRRNSSNTGDDDELRLGNLLGDYVKGRVERFEYPGITGLPAAIRVVNPSAVWHSARMQRPEIIEKLRAHRAELCAAGIVHLRLHGSVARGEASSNVPCGEHGRQHASFVEWPIQ